MTKVESEEDIVAVSRLANAIWWEHYEPIIGPKQVAYMLEQFQSAGAIAAQIARGYEYYLVRCDNRPAGYLALVPDTGAATLMISKIYVRKTARGKGIGRRLLTLAETIANERGLKTLWLTVNRHNRDSIAWYERQGFINAGPTVQDIGGGFVMDDFRMEKALSG